MTAVKIWSASLSAGDGFDDAEDEKVVEKVRSHLGNLTQSFHLTALIGCGASMAEATMYAGPSMSALVEEVKSVTGYEQVLQWAGHSKDPADIEVFLSDCERLRGLPIKDVSKSEISSVSVGGEKSNGEVKSITPATSFVPGVALALTTAQMETIEAFLKASKTRIRARCDFLHADRPASLNPFDLAGHEKFLRCFGRRSGRKSRLRIFTTNYDLCFEMAASKTNYVLIDGFSFTFPRRFSSLNYGLEIAQKAGASADSLEPIENLANLFKLHGSVNWAIKEDGVEMDSNPEEACIIQPSGAKYQHAFQQPYLEMISHYLEAMRKLDQTLIVAGFGFADAHLVAPIESALASSSKFRLVVVDPAIEARVAKPKGLPGFYGTLKSWMDQRDPRITLVNGTFADFMRLVPELHQKSEAEKLADAVRRIAKPIREDDF